MMMMMMMMKSEFNKPPIAIALDVSEAISLPFFLVPKSFLQIFGRIPFVRDNRTTKSQDKVGTELCPERNSTTRRR